MIRRATGPLIALAIIALPFKASGQERKVDTVATETGTVLSAVSVTAGRSTAIVGSASAIVLTVDSLRLGPAAPLERALKQLPFLQVHRNSRGESELSVRGSESRLPAVMLDGLPLGLGWDSRADVSVLPTTGIGQIVFVRGLGSVLQGPNAVGGVVDMGLSSYRGEHVTRTQTRLGIGVDHIGAFSLNGDIAHPLAVGDAEFTFQAGGGFRDVPAVTRSHAVLDQYTTDSDRLTNSDVNEKNGFGSLRYQTKGGAWLGASYSGYSLERGVQPELNISKPRFWRYPEQTRAIAIVTAGTGRRTTPFGSGDAELVVGRNASYTSIQSFLNARYDSIVGRETGDERTTTARLLADHSLGRGELRAAVTFANIDYDEGLDAAPLNVYQQRLWSTGLEVEQPIAGTIRVNAGYALDGSSTPKTAGRQALGDLSAWGGRIGVSGLVTDRWRVHTAVSRRARFAALRELYSGALNRFQPNPNLHPEVLTGGEIGATLLSDVWQLQGVVFHHRLEDAIVRTTLPNKKFFRVNRDEMRSTGLELLAGWSRNGFQVLGDALVQHVRIEDPAVSGTERQPENQPDLRLGANVVIPVRDFRVSLNVDHMGRQYCVNGDTGRNDSISSQTWTGAGIERAFAIAGGMFSRLVASFGVDNIGDAAVYDQCGLPQPGRTLRFGLALR